MRVCPPVLNTKILKNGRANSVAVTWDLMLEANFCEYRLGWNTCRSRRVEGT